MTNIEKKMPAPPMGIKYLLVGKGNHIRVIRDRGEKTRERLDDAGFTLIAKTEARSIKIAQLNFQRQLGK